MRNYFKNLKKIVVLIALSSFFSVFAGSYEDFFAAIKQDDARTVQNLLQRGFDPNTRDPKNFHGLFIALREPSPNVVQVLINIPTIDLNTLTEQGESPLMMAVFKGQVEIAQQLIKLGADVNKTGWTPLHYAATAGHSQLVSILLANYAYIDAESPNKTTPLMMAAHYGTAGVVKLLLEEGADPLLKNDVGLSAIDFAQKANKTDAVEIIAAFVRAKQPKGKW